MLGPLKDTDRPGAGAVIVLLLFIMLIVLVGIVYVILTAQPAPGVAREAIVQSSRRHRRLRPSHGGRKRRVKRFLIR